MTAPTMTRPVLTRTERDLLARVHRWARQFGWERDSLPGMWRHPKYRITVWFGPASHDELTVRYATWPHDLTHRTETVAGGINWLVGLTVLPPWFLTPGGAL